MKEQSLLLGSLLKRYQIITKYLKNLMLTKEDYISRFRSSNCSNKLVWFFKRLVRRRRRSFQELNVILNVLPNQSKTIADFFDLKYRVTLLMKKRCILVVSNAGKEKVKFMTDTAKQLVDRIVECKDQLCAVDIIKEVINNLKVSRNYQRMVEVEKGIRELESAFKELQEEFHVMALPRQYSVVQETRTKANFIYRELVDNYVHEVNRVKMLLEESKTVERAKALEYLKNDANYSNIAKSTMRDYLGASPNYEEWIRRLFNGICKLSVFV